MDFFDDINFDFFSDFESQEEESRYVKPPKAKNIREENLLFEHAESLAREINLEGKDHIFVLLSGNFIFGDFIEALFYDKNIWTERLQISTLSMNLNNVISLENLMKGGFVENLDLIVSDFFYSHERNAIVKDIYKHLDKDNRFQLSVAGIHTKMVSFKTELGKKYVMHGSANLRSSNSVEQLHIQDNEVLYDFVTDFNDKLIEGNKTINKNFRGNRLWQKVQTAEKRQQKEMQ